MQISAFPRHIFWSYAPQADLPEEIVAEQVILYGDLTDIFRLQDLVSKANIAKANQKIEAKGRWLKRVHFINKVILNL